jgi:hypothetical protein
LVSLGVRELGLDSIDGWFLQLFEVGVRIAARPVVLSVVTERGGVVWSMVVVGRWEGRCEEGSDDGVENESGEEGKGETGGVVFVVGGVVGEVEEWRRRGKRGGVWCGVGRGEG